MARPIDPSKYFVGAPCRKCGTSLRYKRDASCVECTRRQNANKRTGIRERELARYSVPPPLSPQKIGAMLSNDARYSGAEDRNRYLNSLLRKKFKLDDEPEAPKPTCYGDVRRMQMQIGATPRPVITRY